MQIDLSRQIIRNLLKALLLSSVFLSCYFVYFLCICGKRQTCTLWPQVSLLLESYDNQQLGYNYTVRFLKNKIHIEGVRFWFCPRVNFIWMFAYSTGSAAAHLSSSSTCVHQSSAVRGRSRHQLHHQHHVSISPNLLFYTHGSQHMFPLQTAVMFLI